MGIGNWGKGIWAFVHARWGICKAHDRRRERDKKTIGSYCTSVSIPYRIKASTNTLLAEVCERERGL